ncbi:MAG TPA: trigger factor, partial [Bryobacterales bacterium]|nr:trigger factor [Bryobacterales bacterium]
MDATEVKNEGLERKIKVTVPAADLEEKLTARLADMAKNARIPGFRPGKVPVAHLRKLYGQQAMAEILDEAVKDGMNRVLMERDERPAYQPEIDLEGDQEAVNEVISGKADLVFTMAYEVTPKVEVKDLSSIELTRFKVAVPDEDIDEAVKSIAVQFKDYEDKPEGAKAEKGDRVVISFVGRVDGEEFEGGSAEDTPLELGSGQFIPGFEDQLIGAKAGEERIVKVTFPEEYGVEALAGKDAEFTVTVKSVESGVEPEINDAFAQKLGMKDLEELRGKVREQAQAEMDNLSALQLKRDVLDALDAQYDFELPEKLVDSEFEQIWHTLEHQMKDEGRTFEDEG